MARTLVILNVMMVISKMETVATTSAKKKSSGFVTEVLILILTFVLCLSKLKNFLNVKILQHNFQIHVKTVYQNH